VSVLVVAEKPSVARDLARVLGAGRKGEGYLEGNGYIVTWALGHLVELAEPDEYGPPWNGRWSFSQLPMIPEKWKLKTSRSTSAQFQVLKKLLNDPGTPEIVCATDAGREGENIFRLIYEHARCRKPFRRLWVSSLTDEAIRQGFSHLQSGAAFDDLAQAARARMQADWLVGMNLTRAYTVHNKVLCTIGRVQTPTLAMIVSRDQEIASFKKSYFYELVAHLEEGFSAKYSKGGQTRIDSKEEAGRLHRELSPYKTGTVLKIEKKIRRNRPPSLYDLNGLQRQANQRFGFTAAQTLEYAQALYETHKLITYPRTESRHISEDMLGELPAILEKLEHPQAPVALQRLRGGLRLGKTYVDRTKLTDHHAILPTGHRPSPNLSPALRKVYDLVVARFVAIFLPEQVVEETIVTLDIGRATFIARGMVVLEEGWKIVDRQDGAEAKDKNGDAAAKEEPAEDGEEDKEESQALPPLLEGQQVHVRAMEAVEKETRPPRPYTDATLLAAMKNAGRQLEDQTLAGAMKDSGLGTPATRAETIERLIRSGYLVRQRRALAATDKGKALVGLVAGPLRSPELTARWEQQLKDIEEGKQRAEAFYQGIAQFVRDLVPKVAHGPALSPEQVAAAQRERNQGRGKKARGRPRVAVQSDSSMPGPLTCPKCNQGKIVEGRRGWGCNRYREGCDFVVWKEVAGKPLTEKQLHTLIAKGKTGVIKGFTSKAGRKFEARLRLDEQWKTVFEFAQRRR
jgi:DNA topoisomerase-3